jgi:glycosyltransferase involved in cell wall biosynthesis
MQEILPKYGIEFEVWYMATRESNRFWKLDKNDFKYSHRFFKGIHFKLGRMFIHLNLLMVLKSLFIKKDIIVIGGAYSSPNNMLLSLLGKKASKILWSEGNMESIQKKTGIALVFKKYLAKKYKYFMIPGTKAKELIMFFDNKISEDKFISLPNLVDKTKFYVTERNEQEVNTIKVKHKLSSEKLIWFSPSRLSPEKGLLEFAINLKNIYNVEFVIAGEGQLRQQLEELILQHSLPVKLLGNLQLEEIIELYKASDLFVLPSFWDSSPLSVIEAIAAGLPILVSNKIGNLPDVLIENHNGWSFDPNASQEIKSNLLKKISMVSKTELSQIGLNSQKIYNRNFDNQKTIENLAEKILQIIH